VNLRFIFFAALIAVGLSPLMIRLALSLALVDSPGTEMHKQHASKTPLAGGLAICLALLGMVTAGGFWHDVEIRSIFLTGLVVWAFGIWDDKKRLPPFVKLAGQVIAAGLLVILGVHVNIFGNQALDYFVTVLWIVAVTNAYNFVDSMDGLATGLAGIAAAFFMLVALDSGQLTISAFSAVLMGILVGIFYFTAPPARFFLGDSGAQLLGFILGALAIVYNPLGFLPAQSWYIPVMLVGVPLFDMGLVVVSRLRRGKPIYLSGLDHTYHRLIGLGLHPNRAVLTMHFASIMLGSLAFIALSLPPLWANIVFSACFVTGLACLVFLEKWFNQTLIS
jgi:UDP-GlcNAc:undecaprenyl-phosphate GlcNAc-1-phosphate transferase